MNYITTVYSHFAAIRLKKLCDSRQIPARLMPVPRDLSSSCGTCVRSEGSYISISCLQADEIEQIVAIIEDGYQVIFRAADS